MKMKRPGFVAVMQTVFALVLALGTVAQAGPLAPSGAEIDRSVTSSLTSLLSSNQGAQALNAKAKAVLVFPEIKKGAFIVGAQYGYGALRKGRTTVGYYRTAAASYGFQAGVKKFGYALFFMTDDAVAYLDKSGGWAIGTGPSLVIVDEGMARSLTTTSLRSDVYAFVFDQKGLMGGIGLEGSKVTKITPGD
jgi:lipid-binding SYLF domain-containing protein